MNRLFLLDFSHFFFLILKLSLPLFLLYLHARKQCKFNIVHAVAIIWQYNSYGEGKKKMKKEIGMRTQKIGSCFSTLIG